MENDEELEIKVPNEEDGTISLPQDLIDEVDTEETTKNLDSNEENTENNEGVEEKKDEDSDGNNDFADKESLLKALNAERTARKKAEKIINDNKITKSKTAYEELLENGVDENIAKTISKMVEKPSQEIAELRFKNNLLALSKKSGFEDAEEYAEDIKTLVDKGLSIEQSYYAVTGGVRKEKTRTTEAEIKRQVEAEMINKAKRNKALDIETEGFTKQSKSKQYSSLDIAMAKASGMSVEDYVAYKDISSSNEDSKYRKRKEK